MNKKNDFVHDSVVAALDLVDMGADHPMEETKDTAGSAASAETVVTRVDPQDVDFRPFSIFIFFFIFPFSGYINP